MCLPHENRKLVCFVLYYILNNYLASVKDTSEHLTNLVDALREDDAPVVLVVYGDHNPWLGYSNSVYSEQNINIDMANREGFYNYFGTRYMIWANDAAKSALGKDFSGEGPDISPCFLMNLLFEQCGWQGNAFMQATEAVRQELPVLTSLGRYVSRDGELVETPDEVGQAALETYRALEYYNGTHFKH